MQWTSNQRPEARVGQEASMLHNLSLYSNSSLKDYTAKTWLLANVKR